MESGLKRAILEDVAAGRISAEEAERRLGETSGPVVVRSSEVLRIKARLSGGGPIEVVGDDSVGDVRVDGPSRCSVKTKADSAVVVGDLGEQAVLLVNPDAEFDIEINAGDGSITGIRGPLRAVFNTGDARIAGLFDRGDSRIDANTGEVHLTLAAGSDVRVIVRAPVEVNVDPALVNTGRGEWTVGDGRATFEIDGNMGGITIDVE